MFKDLSKRDLLILAAALGYAQANRDDVNEAFADEEMPEIIKVHGGDLFGPEVGARELARLHDSVLAAASCASDIDEGTDNVTLDAILEHAEQHGAESEVEDGATHEVGDLQDALSIAWELLDPAGRKELVKRFFAEIAQSEE